MYQYDSRKIKKGDTYICLPGGENYIKEALEKGAADYIKMDRQEMAKIANEYYQYPSKKLKVIGVTGTNGKTTITQVLTKALNFAEYKAGVLGTINAPLTTPESLDIQRLMAEHLALGGTHFVMEVSSHGIAQKRIEGIEFCLKILTNITQDHLDFHKTFENYRDTKLNFMKEGDNIKIYPEDFNKEEIDFKNPFFGMFNEENLKACKLALLELGLGADVVKKALENAKEPPGRFESIEEGQKFIVVVDYAHTPDGLEKILQTGREIANKRQGKLIALFGCGGDRDRGKRPKMAVITSKYTDFFVITQDNPRSEDPEQIKADILSAFSEDVKHYAVINDRAEAIRMAIDKAQDNDIVILAGKGHETYQILKSGKIHFDDREEARRYIKERIKNESIY